MHIHTYIHTYIFPIHIQDVQGHLQFFLNRKLTHAPILRYILDGGVEGSGESGELGESGK